MMHRRVGHRDCVVWTTRAGIVDRRTTSAGCPRDKLQVVHLSYSQKVTQVWQSHQARHASPREGLIALAPFDLEANAKRASQLPLRLRSCFPALQLLFHRRLERLRIRRVPFIELGVLIPIT